MDESTKKNVEYLDWYFTCDDGTADKDAQKAWSELRKQITNKEPFICPKCGKKLHERSDLILTSYPPKRMYECNCGYVEYH